MLLLFVNTYEYEYDLLDIILICVIDMNKSEISFGYAYLFHNELLQRNKD